MRQVVDEYNRPRYRGTKAATIAAGIWLVLNKTGWLPDVAWQLSLPGDFFSDPEISGYVTIGLTWLIREAREVWGKVASLDII